MGTQIAIAAIGSVTATILALAIVAVLIRLVGEQRDTAAEDRRVLREGQRTLLERIEELQEAFNSAAANDGLVQRTLLERIEELQERPLVRQFLIINSTRNDIIGVWAGHISDVGTLISAKKEMREELQKHPGVDIEILVMRRGIGSVLSAIPKL